MADPSRADTVFTTELRHRLNTVTPSFQRAMFQELEATGWAAAAPLTYQALAGTYAAANRNLTLWLIIVEAALTEWCTADGWLRSTVRGLLHASFFKGEWNTLWEAKNHTNAVVGYNLTFMEKLRRFAPALNGSIRPSWNVYLYSWDRVVEPEMVLPVLTALYNLVEELFTAEIMPTKQDWLSTVLMKGFPSKGLKVDLSWDASEPAFAHSAPLYLSSDTLLHSFVYCPSVPHDPTTLRQLAVNPNAPPPVAPTNDGVTVGVGQNAAAPTYHISPPVTFWPGRPGYVVADDLPTALHLQGCLKRGVGYLIPGTGLDGPGLPGVVAQVEMLPFSDPSVFSALGHLIDVFSAALPSIKDATNRELCVAHPSCYSTTDPLGPLEVACTAVLVAAVKASQEDPPGYEEVDSGEVVQGVELWTTVQEKVHRSLTLFTNTPEFQPEREKLQAYISLFIVLWGGPHEEVCDFFYDWAYPNRPPRGRFDLINPRPHAAHVGLGSLGFSGSPNGHNYVDAILAIRKAYDWYNIFPPFPRSYSA